jgi:hypothetical protein
MAVSYSGRPRTGEIQCDARRIRSGASRTIARAPLPRKPERKSNDSHDVRRCAAVHDALAAHAAAAAHAPPQSQEQFDFYAPYARAWRHHCALTAGIETTWRIKHSGRSWAEPWTARPGCMYVHDNRIPDSALAVAVARWDIQWIGFKLMRWCHLEHHRDAIDGISSGRHHHASRIASGLHTSSVTNCKAVRSEHVNA